MTRDPVSGFLAPATVRRHFVSASLVPETRVIEDYDAAPGTEDGETGTSASDGDDLMPAPMLSLMNDEPAGPVNSSKLATIEEFLDMDEEAFEMDEHDFAIPEDTAEPGQGSRFTFQSFRVPRGTTSTLRMVADRFKVDVEPLAVINNRPADGALKAGDELVVPMGLGMFHTVSPGESLWRISRQYNLRPTTILFFNRAKQKSITLRVGERLFVPLGAIGVEDARRIASNHNIRGLLENKLAFAWPVHGRLSSRYGWRVHPVLHRGRMHQGIDVAVPTGTTIRAAERGRVVFSGWRGGAGLCVIIEHPNGMYSFYMHCSKIITKAGKWVARRQTIAKVGSTGLATGPHLHFSLKRDEKMLDPLRVLSLRQL